MEFRYKRILSMVVVCAYLFLGGVEFAVIFPTAWEYLQSLGVYEEYLLGVTVAAYSISGAMAGVLGGRWSDQHPRGTKALCIVCIGAMVVGNLLYMIGINVWLIVFSRFICGLGTGAGAALLAYVCRTTTVKERTAMLSICNACRQMGILVGPAFQILLTHIDFNMFALPITRLNAAGLFMAGLWLIFMIICLTMFRDLTHEWRKRQHRRERGESEEAEEDQHNDSISSSSGMISTRSTSLARALSQSLVMSPGDVSLDKYTDEILRDTVMSLLGTIFTLFFGQIVIETLIPIYMKEFFLLGDVETSLMYMAGGIECLVLLLVLIGLSRVSPDWVLSLVGMLLVLTGFVWLSATLPSYQRGDTSNIPSFVACWLIISAGYPITNVASTSLISKALSVETQGTGQGLRRLMTYLGLVLGPLWAGATLKRPKVLLGVAVGLILLHLALFFDVLPRLRHVERSARLLLDKAELGERTPLIDPSRNRRKRNRSERSSSSHLGHESSSGSQDDFSEGFTADNELSFSSV